MSTLESLSPPFVRPGMRATYKNGPMDAKDDSRRLASPSYVVSGDVRLAVYEYGDPSAETVVLVHGWPDTHAVWDDVVPLLARHFHVVTYDTRGHGASALPGPKEQFTLELLADDAVAVAEAVSPDEPVHLVGHDWGSIQLWEAVCRPDASERFASFTSISGPSLDHASSWLRGLAKHPTPRNLAALVRQIASSSYVFFFQVRRVPEAVLSRFGRRLWPLFLRATEGFVSPRLSPTLTDDMVAGVRLYRANMLQRLWRPDPRRSTVPTQLVVNTRDIAMTPAVFQGASDWSLDLTRVDLDRGHWLPVSEPDLVADLVTTFVRLRSTPDSAAAGGSNRAAATQTSEATVPSTSTHPGPVALHARKVAFDISATPVRWIGKDPVASHFASAINFMLPEAERWLCETFNEALPLIEDEELRATVRGFVGQEAIHAQTHDEVLSDLFRAHGFDTAPMVGVAVRLFQQVLGPRNLPTAAARHRHLVARLAMAGGIESLTAMVGDWILNAPMEEFDADPAILDLYRWHGAEEVEHRMVAHDVAEYFGVGYLQRTMSMLMVYPAFFLILARVARDLVRQDPSLPDHGYARMWVQFIRSGRRGTLPSLRLFGRNARLTMHPRFTPAWVGDTAQAVAYLAKSPAARAAS